MVFVIFSYFSTIAYSADGETILAAGKSKNVCIYNVKEGILLKKFEITQNHSLDGLDVRHSLNIFSKNHFNCIHFNVNRTISIGGI